MWTMLGLRSAAPAGADAPGRASRIAAVSGRIQGTSLDFIILASRRTGAGRSFLFLVIRRLSYDFAGGAAKDGDARRHVPAGARLAAVEFSIIAPATASASPRRD